MFSQAHWSPNWTPKGGSVSLSHVPTSMEMLCFLSEINCQTVLVQKEGMKLRDRDTCPGGEELTCEHEYIYS